LIKKSNTKLTQKTLNVKSIFLSLKDSLIEEEAQKRNEKGLQKRKNRDKLDCKRPSRKAWKKVSI